MNEPDQLDIEIHCTPTLRGYIERLIEMEGYGDDAQEVVMRFVWDRVNELIVAGRLP